MKKSTVIAGLIVCLAIIIILLPRKINPISISNGLTYLIKKKDRDRFYVIGLNRKYLLGDFENNRINDPRVNNTEVLHDKELYANSIIDYINIDDTTPYDSITIQISGDVSQKQVKAFLK